MFIHYFKTCNIEMYFRSYCALCKYIYIAICLYAYDGHMLIFVMIQIYWKRYIYHISNPHKDMWTSAANIILATPTTAISEETSWKAGIQWNGQQHRGHVLSFPLVRPTVEEMYNRTCTVNLSNLACPRRCQRPPGSDEGDHAPNGKTGVGRVDWCVQRLK